MVRGQRIRAVRARLHGEDGFTLLETVIAITIVFASITALAYTATIGFRYTSYGRARIQATGVANRIMEDIRGLAYSKVTSGIPDSELASDPRIVNCSGVYRFQTCAGEKIVASTFPVGYTAAWLVPHTGAVSVGKLSGTYATYVTNDDPTSSPYRVTVFVSWTGGAIAAPNNFVKVQSLFFSPRGCVNPNTHPFAAPCQPFFYGQVDAPQARLDVTGQLHDFDVDFDSLEVTLPGIAATVQDEQTKQLNATSTLSGIEFVDSTGNQAIGDQRATSDADDDVETTAPIQTGGSSTNTTPLSASRSNTDPPLEIGLFAAVPAGDLEGRATTVRAALSDTYACPTTGARETDQLPCAGGHVRQVGTSTVSVPVTHVTPTVGAANLARFVGPAQDTTAKIDRDAAGTNEDGLVDVSASRTLGTVQLGGFPSSGMTPPAGMSATQTNDTNYCVRLVGYADTVRAVAGERTGTNPSASISAGTFHYYNGSGFSSRAVTDATLDSLTVTCLRSQVVGLNNVSWRVTVAAGGIRRASTTTTQTTDPTDAQTKWDAQAITHAIEIEIRYEYIVDGVHEIDLTATFDAGDLLAHGVYQPPPAVGA